VLWGQNVDFTDTTLVSSGGFPHTPARAAATLPTTRYRSRPKTCFRHWQYKQGQTALLSNPSQVEVWVDSNTQKLNTQPLAAGSTVRFYGLVFNRNGTLRMDCAQVNDGVA